MTFAKMIKVRFAHCDPAGIVFYPRYFEMLNSVVEDWFAERLGASFASLHMDQNLGVPTVRLETEFTAPSRLGNMLKAELHVDRIGNSSCSLRVLFSCEDQPRIAVSLVIVAMTLTDGKSLPWPQSLRTALEFETESQSSAAHPD